MLLSVLYDFNLLILIIEGLGSNLSTMNSKIMMFDIEFSKNQTNNVQLSLENHPQIWETRI